METGNIFKKNYEHEGRKYFLVVYINQKSFKKILIFCSYIKKPSRTLFDTLNIILYIE